MTQREVLSLFRRGIYTADIDHGIIYGRDGRELKQQWNTKENVLFVQLYDAELGKRSCVNVNRVIWMVATNSTIPRKFEVHHEDRNVENNAFYNLFCVHEIDHRKIHGKWQPESEETPF